MNLNNSEVQPKTSVADSNGDSAKLLSLLALATGAVAMPQTSNADIIYTDLTANPIHVGPAANANYVINNLPGTAQIGFHTHHRSTFVSSSRFVTGKQQAGYVRIRTNASFFVMANAGQTWNQIGGNVTISGAGGANNYSNSFPPSYNNKFLLFRFKDSTQPGSPLRYGWINLGLANAPGNGNFPDIAINGYAWDTTGAQIIAGQVPEPTAPALLALGALTLGAKGLRSWRKNRPAGTKS
jgi:PEP-CTERM putative exosortase interaction domain